jgi:N-acetylmuramic acid 6-phosphate etherase
MEKSLSHLVTETRNPNTMDIDAASSLDIVKKINAEDQKVAFAVEKELPQIAAAVDVITERMQQGGRLFYCGAGTSGRIGVLDASECPPTYGTSPDTVIALMAGGAGAILQAVEGAEDDETLCIGQMKEHSFCGKDVLVGIAASGRTPYVIGGMRYAKELGAPVISVTCNPDSKMAALADIAISPVVGPEAVTGSTRMKSGTAQKMVLNMLSSATMIRQGKVYENLMVDLQATNEKLVERTRRIVMEAAHCDKDAAEAALAGCSRKPKTAIVMLLANISAEEAERRLEQTGGHIRQALMLN